MPVRDFHSSHVRSAKTKHLLLLDVAFLSTLGLQIASGVMATLIAHNTTLPTKKNQTFSTNKDSQSSVLIHVCECERKFTNKNVGRPCAASR